MYVMYIRRVYGRAFSRSSSLSDGFNKPLMANNCVNTPLPINSRTSMYARVAVQGAFCSVLY